MKTICHFLAFEWHLIQNVLSATKILDMCPLWESPSPLGNFTPTIYMDQGKINDDVPRFHKYFAEINKYIMLY